MKTSDTNPGEVEIYWEKNITLNGQKYQVYVEKKGSKGKSKKVNIYLAKLITM